jgi:dienelactone hydrolase
MNYYLFRISTITLFAITIALAYISSLAHAQETMADFSSSPPSGQYAFKSWTPKSVPDLIKGNSSGEGVDITGHLFLPAGVDKVPAVILMHGSGGIYPAMVDFWPKRFNAEHVAVLAVDSFGPRGVQSTADDQSKVPFAADAADAFSALKLLASHPRIDPSRLAVMGFSRGGITAWRTGVERLIAAQKLPNGLRFAAHVQMYSGGCVGPFRLIVKPGVFSKAPMLWVHGDADDYCSMAPCQDYAERIAKAGTPVEFVVIKGAHHKFDFDDTKRYDLRNAQKTSDECPIETDIDTLMTYDRFTGQPLSGDEYEAVLKKSCRALGASVEGNHEAREKAAQAIMTFFQKAFAQ